MQRQLTPIKVDQDNKYDLKKLTEFDPALVYSFMPEASRFSENSVLYELNHGAAQHQDIFEAYLYAQEVLAEIKRIGIRAITSSLALQWLNQAHSFIARTLAYDYQVAAGEYTKIQIFRWHAGASTQDIMLYAAGYNIDPTDCHRRMQAAGIKRKTIDAFVAISKKVSADKSIKIAEDQLPFIDFKQTWINGVIAINKLAAAYYAGRLTTEEKTVIDKVVTICLPPSQLPQAMQAFADALVEKWHTCDQNNLDQVAELGAFAFREVTTVHGYFNGNGRLAAWLSNVLFRSLNHPSILVKKMSELKGSSYSYKNDIIKFNNDPNELLLRFKLHFKNRLLETQTSGPEVDNIKAEVIELRIKLASILTYLIDHFPRYDFLSFYEKKAELFESSPENKKSVTENNRDEYYALKYFIRMFEKLRAHLSTSSTYSATSVAASAAAPVCTVVSRQYTDTEKTAIISRLEELTGFSGWKTYKNKGSLVVLLNMEPGQEDTSKAIIAALDKTNAVHAQLKLIPTSKAPVVYLESINLDALVSISNLPELNPAKAKTVRPE